jgi:hypothetical protein
LGPISTFFTILRIHGDPLDDTPIPALLAAPKGSPDMGMPAAKLCFTALLLEE